MTVGLPNGGSTPDPRGDAESRPPSGSTAVTALTDFGKTAIDALRQYPPLVVGVLVFVCLAVVMLGAAPTLGLPGFVVLVLAAMCLVGVAMTKRARETDEQFKREAEVTTMDTVRYERELDEEHRTIIRQALQSAAYEAAKILGVDRTDVRSNIFGMGADNRLQIIGEFTHNMQSVSELTVSIAPGTGSTGRCYATRAPNIAVRRSDEGTEPDWGVDILAESEMKKLVPALCWIVSVPVIVGGKEDAPVWIVNVDGLVSVDFENLQTLTLSLLPYSEAVSLLLRTTLKERL